MARPNKAKTELKTAAPYAKRWGLLRWRGASGRRMALTVNSPKSAGSNPVAITNFKNKTMTQNLAPESTIVWDNKCPNGEVPEQPIVIEDYRGDDSISISGPNGDVKIPYRMVDEICKVMKGYKPKE